jgi:hypothetical protein
MIADPDKCVSDVPKHPLAGLEAILQLFIIDTELLFGGLRQVDPTIGSNLELMLVIAKRIAPIEFGVALLDA